jgi:hypothetical protein
MHFDADPTTHTPEYDMVVQMVFFDRETFDIYIKYDLSKMSMGEGTHVVRFTSSDLEDPMSTARGLAEENPFSDENTNIFDSENLVGIESVTACNQQYHGVYHFQSSDGMQDVWIKTDGSIPITGMVKMTSSNGGGTESTELCDYAFSGAQEDITEQERANAITWEQFMQIIPS